MTEATILDSGGQGTTLDAVVARSGASKGGIVGAYGSLIIVAVRALSFAMGNITAIALDRPAEQSGLAASVFGTAQFALAGNIGTVSAAPQGERVLVLPRRC